MLKQFTRFVRPGWVRVAVTDPLAEHDGIFVQESEPLYLEELEIFFAGERVSRFELTPALSDDPFITFALLARREGSLEVRLANNRGQRFEARHAIRFS